MRRLIGVAAFGLLLAVPVWAQRGGGHAGGFGGTRGGFGGHAGFSGHGFSGGHMGGARVSGGHVSGRNFSGRSGFSHGFAHSSRIGSSRFPRSHDPIRERLHFRNNCFGGNCRGFGYYPWGWGYYDPFLWGWWDHDSNYDQDYDREHAYTDQLNAENVELRRMLRQEQDDRDEDAYARRPYQAPQPASEAKEPVQTEPPTPTVLVFRDQHKQEVSNYAIVGQTLWSFVPQHHQKIPLADLDIPATVKANDDRGVTFRVPAS